MNGITGTSGMQRGSTDLKSAGTAVILMTDVEPAVRINAALEAAGYTTVVISPMDDVRGELRRGKPDILILTGALLDSNNVALVRQQLWDGVAVFGLTDVSDPAIERKLYDIGYAELFPKPAVVADIVDSVRRRLERRKLAQLTGLIGESDRIREVLVKIEQIAPVSSTVLVEGESGTGKELVARAIHRMSPRRARPFIAVNVGALPETLLESELFGHEKGAFTGAAERRLGRFELADTGTLFLDEIGEIPQSTQVRLLRVLEEREFTRVGGTTSIPVDVRVIAATNRPLREHVENGEFRADLFYRLNVLSMYLPPLRERREDIPLLVRRFVTEFSKQHDRPFNGISADAMQLLEEYSWPGNVRELRNLVESMVVLAHGREVTAEDIPPAIREQGSARLLPVHVKSVVHESERAVSGGREFEFIVRTLVDLKLQVEELRRRLDTQGAVGVDDRHWGGGVVAEVAGGGVHHLSGGYDGAVGVGDDANDVHQGAGGRGRGRERYYERNGYSGRDTTATAAHDPATNLPLSDSGRGIEPRDAAPLPVVITLGPGVTMADIERRAIEAALRSTGGNRRKAADMLGIGERTLYRKLREYDADLDSADDGEMGSSDDAE